jgi:hypothetical protein
VGRLRAIVLLLIMVLACGCKGPGEPPSELSYKGLSIVVWDAKEPHLPGASPYTELVARAVEAFAREHGVEVEVLFQTRSKIEELLSGNYKGEEPSLVYSTEWPFVGSGIQDLTDLVSVGDYQDAAITYWTDAGKIMGIPSYVHWLCLAKRGAGPVHLKDSTGYYLTGPGFLDSGLDGSNSSWTEQSLLDYVEWVKSTFGSYVEEPLDLWIQNEFNALFPVTPHLLKWLRLAQGDGSVQMLPIPGIYGEPRFHFTVPGYVVTAQEDNELRCAVELGKTLASTRGKWAARATGGMPAYIQDMPVFHVESGLTREERLALMSGFENSGCRMGDLSEFLKRTDIRNFAASLIERYLSGRISKGEFEEGIRSGMKGYNNH